MYNLAESSLWNKYIDRKCAVAVALLQVMNAVTKLIGFETIYKLNVRVCRIRKAVIV